MCLKAKQPLGCSRRVGAAWPAAPKRANLAGFTIIEVVIAMGIVVMVFAGVINSYIQSGKRVQWTGYSLAAQSLAGEVIEQAKSATWDPTQPTNSMNQVMTLNLYNTNYSSSTATFTGYSTGILDVPYSGTNYTTATNFVTVQMITGVGGATNVQMQFIRVDTVWPFYSGGRNQLFTNSVATLIAPD